MNYSLWTDLSDRNQEEESQSLINRKLINVMPRDGFRASPGYTLLAADYSQIELRIMAHFSRLFLHDINSYFLVYF